MGKEDTLSRGLLKESEGDRASAALSPLARWEREIIMQPVAETGKFP